MRSAEVVTSPIESLSAVTLATRDMARAITFYRALGFEMLYGGDDAELTSFAAGSSFLNVIVAPKEASVSWWGRAIFYVDDVDALYARALAAGFTPEAAPQDATWGERYFHLADPDGHELSFARRLEG
ncbi:MAG: putative glyoxalase superfamily protein PhnB [Alphaproteobacteria bacterium]